MISKRLSQIAKLIDKDKTVIDVGTDHAMLPCFLVKNNISNKVYASDNKQGPLNAAIKSISNDHLEDKVIPILSNGLDNCPLDVEIVNINGMGFYTVKDILDNHNIKRFKKLIVQVNKHPELLRQYLSDHHYTILDELIIKDDFYYEVEVFNTNYHDSYSDIEIKYGPINLNRKEEIFIDYLNYQLKYYSCLPCDKYEEKIKELKQILNKE